MGSGHEDPAKQQNVAKNSMRLDLDQAEVSLSLLDLIARFKSLTTTQYIRGVKENNWKRFDKKIVGIKIS